MIQRLLDYLRELRIERLKRQAIAAGNSMRAYALWMQFYDEIDKRSEQQVRRAELAAKYRRMA